ncbi:hypothetical protein ACI8AC_02400 [Geodermatophilus sp. SYSU D00758]
MWDAGRLDGTEWQGIRYLTLEIATGADFPAVVTAHLNHPVGDLTAENVVIRGGRRRPVPPHEVDLGDRSVTVRFRGFGDHSPHTVTLTAGGGRALHPFFASAEFRFTINCEASDCRPLPGGAGRAAVQPPAVDLLTKDFTGFVGLLTDRVRVRSPAVTDLSGASFERMLLELLAWYGDMTSYYQDRVAAEAFVETARQRFSLRQHAALLGAPVDDGRAPATVLAFDVGASGFVPAGLAVELPTAPDEVPVTFTVTARTRVLAEHASSRLRVAAFPGAAAAQVPVGATELLLWGDGPVLRRGDRVAFVQGSSAQVVTLTADAVRRTAAGWVSDPEDTFDPATDPPAAVTRLTWAEPLAQALRPWGPVPLSIHANLVDARYGTPRIAVAGGAPPERDAVPLRLTREAAVVERRGAGGALLLRALRVPESPVVHDDGPAQIGEGGSAPALDVTISGDRWTRVTHLLASRSFDRHYTTSLDEEGAVWLHFGDGVEGHEVELDGPERPQGTIRLDYRLGDPLTGNVGLGTLTRVVAPATGSAVGTALTALAGVTVTNVLPATGGRAPATLARLREELPRSLRHGPLQRAVTLADYAAVAMQVPGVGRATARARGGPFNTVAVLVDPAGADDLDDDLRRRVHTHLETLRMTGREHVVLAADYVALEVALVACAAPGVPPNRVRDRVLGELVPGSAERPGWFHPDRLSFGDAVRLGDLLAFVQGLPGVRAVTATAFRPLGERVGPPIHDLIPLGRTRVARLDADPDFLENGTLTVQVVGLDADGSAFTVDGHPAAEGVGA